MLELIEVLDESARRGRLGTASAVIEHIAFAVEALDQAVASLERLGIELVERPSADGGRTAFTKPASSAGVMLQVVERPPA